MTLIPEGQSIFVVDIEYIVPIEKVEPFIEPHIAFLDQNYEAKNFLASGPKVPRSGGVILAVGETKQTVEQIIAKDPFYREKVARYQITQFQPNKSRLS